MDTIVSQYVTFLIMRKIIFGRFFKINFKKGEKEFAPVV